MTSVLLITILCCLSGSFGLQENSCMNKTTCSECIQAEGGCAWCMDPDANDRPRCFQPDSKAGISCSKGFVENPENQHIFYSNENLGHETWHIHNSVTRSVTQIQPQHVGLKLRISELGYF